MGLSIQSCEHHGTPTMPNSVIQFIFGLNDHILKATRKPQLSKHVWVVRFHAETTLTEELNWMRIWQCLVYTQLSMSCILRSQTFDVDCRSFERNLARGAQSVSPPSLLKYDLVIWRGAAPFSRWEACANTTVALGMQHKFSKLRPTVHCAISYLKWTGKHFLHYSFMLGPVIH